MAMTRGNMEKQVSKPGLSANINKRKKKVLLDQKKKKKKKKKKA
tara:strand:+ start:121 stop:252 length:132 start_codon:yes stop_codon:yes gene_type:complete